MKIAFLHGLESTAVGDKRVNRFKDLAEVYAPEIDYRKDKIFAEVLENVKEFNPDLIVGSSMGGFFAYHIAAILGIPSILINPAIAKRSFDPDGVPIELERKHVWFPLIIYGTKDDVVKPIDTENKLLQDNVTARWYPIDNCGHRIPYENIIGVLENEIEHVARRLTVA